jgi:hypothetical protein
VREETRAEKRWLQHIGTLEALIDGLEE